MTYVLDNSQAKFASAQAGLKRHIGLRQRLRVKHAVNSLRQPRRWAERATSYRHNRAAIAEYASREFEADGCVNVTRQLESECSAAVARWKPRCDAVLAEKGDTCPKIPWKVEELLDDDTVRALCLNRFVAGTIASYLGEAPVFAGVTLWIGRKEVKFAGSPFYHLDSCGLGCAKFYVYLSDVGPGFGEFTYVPRTDSERFTNATGYLGDAVPDADVHRFFGRDPAVVLTGPAGSGFLIDTTKCLHFGSRCTAGNRYALIVAYQRWSAPNSEVGRGPAYLKSKGYVPDDPLSRLLVVS